MLVLSRKQGERLVLINNETGEQLAEITMGQFKGNRATLCVEATDSIRILRGELNPKEPRKLRDLKKGGPNAPEAN